MYNQLMIFAWVVGMIVTDPVTKYMSVRCAYRTYKKADVIDHIRFPIFKEPIKSSSRILISRLIICSNVLCAVEYFPTHRKGDFKPNPAWRSPYFCTCSQIFIVLSDLYKLHTGVCIYFSFSYKKPVWLTNCMELGLRVSRCLTGRMYCCCVTMHYWSHNRYNAIRTIIYFVENLS